MTQAGAVKGSKSDDNIVLSLIREELHKLEYLYGRDCRMNPVQRIGKVSSHLKTSAAKIKAQKESTLTDLANVRSEKHKQQDKENTIRIQKYLKQYDVFKETIDSKIKELKDIRTFNYDVMSEIVKLELAAEKRRQQVSDNMDKIKAKRALIEDQMYQNQCQINQLLWECKTLRKGKLRTLLLDRESTHRHHMKRIMDIGKFRNEGDELVHEALNYYKIYEVGQKEALRLVEIHKEQNLAFLMTMNDLDRVHIEKSYHQDLYDTKLEMRTTSGPKELSRDEKRIQKQTEEANKKISVLKRGLQSLKIYSPELNEEFICNMYDDLEQTNFSRVKRICEIEETTIKLRADMLDLVTSIQTGYKMLDTERKEKSENLLEVQAYAEHFAEEMESQETKLNLAEDSSFAIVSALMDTYGQLCGQILKEFLDKRVTKSNLDLLFHLIEQRIGEYQYEKEYLEIRKNVEINGGALPKKIVTQSQNYPASYGGPFKPDIFINNQQISVAEEVDDIINAVGILHPIDEQEAIKLALEELQRIRTLNRNNEVEEERRLSEAEKRKEIDAEEGRKNLLRHDVIKKAIGELKTTSGQELAMEEEDSPVNETEEGEDPET